MTVARPISAAAPAAAPADDAATADLVAARGLMARLRDLADTQPARLFLKSTQARPLAFAEAHATVIRICDLLRALRLPPGTPVGLLCAHHGTQALTLMACLEAGLVPVLLPTRAAFAPLRDSVIASGCAALVADGGGGRNLPDVAMRLAAAHDTIRFVLGFGSELPNGVLALDHMSVPAGPVADGHKPGGTILCASAGGAPVARALSTMIATAQDHVAVAGLTGDMRVICPLTTEHPAGLICGFLSALLAGAEFFGLDAPDSGDLTQALLAPRPAHLVWPAGLEDMLDDIPGDALHGVTVVQSVPWEFHGYSAMSGSTGVRLVDAWPFGHTAVAFTQRLHREHPNLPPIQTKALLAPQGPALTLALDGRHMLHAAGAAVAGFSASAPHWVPLDCTLFRDHRGQLAAIDMSTAAKVLP